jgi:DNA (cytosine-5)-methyltransferase 1
MQHLGDITKINGALVDPVNVIIGGSPCQDLSVAGKRAGLAGERSGLFMEQLRVIKEMRTADVQRGKTGKNIRPRFMVWENVPGAFSSNKGADFGAVLQETIKVVCEKAPTVPMPKNGWPTAGCLTDVAGQWSVAWRVLDAQFWGVPQRRRRIALVADFGGLTAPEILFERESVRGYYTQGSTPWERVTRDATSCFGATGNENRINDTPFCLQGNGIGRSDNAGCNGKGWAEDVGYTLNTADRHATVYSIDRESFSSGAGFDRKPGITENGVTPPSLDPEYPPFAKSMVIMGSKKKLMQLKITQTTAELNFVKITQFKL